MFCGLLYLCEDCSTPEVFHEKDSALSVNDRTKLERRICAKWQRSTAQEARVEGPWGSEWKPEPARRNAAFDEPNE